MCFFLFPPCDSVDGQWELACSPWWSWFWCQDAAATDEVPDTHKIVTTATWGRGRGAAVNPFIDLRVWPRDGVRPSRHTNASVLCFASSSCENSDGESAWKLEELFHVENLRSAWRCWSFLQVLYKSLNFNSSLWSLQQVSDVFRTPVGHYFPTSLKSTISVLTSVMHSWP